jgi:hypothetical protein
VGRPTGNLVPEGQNENSPAFQRRDEANRRRSPGGTAETIEPMSRSQPQPERDCASEASRSNVGIETCEGDFYAWCGDKLSPLRSGWGQLVPTSPEGTAESGSSVSLFQPSLRDSGRPRYPPDVENAGLFSRNFFGAGTRQGNPEFPKSIRAGAQARIPDEWRDSKAEQVGMTLVIRTFGHSFVIRHFPLASTPQ